MDSFAHRTLATSFAILTGTYNTINNGGTLPNHGGGGISFDTTNKRTADHACSLKIVQDGVSATAVRRTFSSSTVNGSFYFRATAAPSVASNMFFLVNASGNIKITLETDGKLGAQVAGGTVQKSTGTVTDGNWHLVDWKADTTANPQLFDVRLDGTALNQASAGSAAAACTAWGFGGTSNSYTATFWIQDHVISTTAADYPIGGHICKALTINGEGTDNLGGLISDAGGGTTNLYQSIDDVWDATGPDTTTYIRQTGTGAGNYAECTFTDPSESTIWDVRGVAAVTTAGTQANSLAVQIGITGSNPHASIFYGDISGSTGVVGYQATLLARPSGGWTGTNLGNAYTRVGLSLDASPEPRCTAVMLEYAAPWSSGTQYTQAVAATATLTMAAVKQANKPVSLTSTLSSALSRLSGKPLSLSATLGPAVTKQAAKPVPVTTTLTVGTLAQKIKQVAIAAATTVTTTVTKQAGKLISAASTLGVTQTRQLSFVRIVVVSVTHTVSLTKQTVKAVMAVSVSHTVGLVKQAGKAVSTAVTASISLVSSKVYLKTLDVATTVTVALTEKASYYRTLAVSVAHTVGLSTAAAFHRTISVTVSLAVSLVKAVSKTLEASISFLVALTKRVSTTIAVTSTVNVALSAAKVIHRTLDVTSSFVVNLATQFIPGGPPAQAVAAFIRRMRRYLSKDEP